MTNLSEALEVCLQELEQGVDLETVLFRYPELAEELRPILEGSIHARSMAILAPAPEVVRRNRSRVLQQAAQMREASVKSSQRLWFSSFRRLAVTLVVVFVLFAGGTGMVRAASTTLPGDDLYPVKRTWEDVLLLFTFDAQQREALEVEHENERLYELRELFAEGRAAEVDFAGIVTSQNGDEWIISGVKVILSAQTELRDGPITVGNAVRVRGHTQGDGIVRAERIRLLSADENLPDIEVEHESEGEDNEGENKQEEDNSGKGSREDSPDAHETKIPEKEFESKDESFDGTVTAIDQGIVVVDGIELNVSTAEIEGTPSIGATVRVEGYYDQNGVFIVVKIEFKSSDSGSGSGSGDSSGSDDSQNDGSSDDHSGGGGGDDSGSHDSSDDSGGGGGNSGSGGGGDD